jgi:hypothetical protein
MKTDRPRSSVNLAEDLDKSVRSGGKDNPVFVTLCPDKRRGKVHEIG